MNLSDKRRRAGRRGAAARWGHGNVEQVDGKPRLATARPVARLRQGRTDWYRIENRGGASVTDVYVYDEIGYFGVTAADFVRELRDVDTAKIALHLNTPGGDVYDAIAIYNALLKHSATVDVVVDALAASAGSFIAQAGDQVTMTRNAQMMIHDAWGLTIGNAEDMRDMADRLDKTSDNVADIYAERAGGTVQEWRDRMRAETWYSAQEAVDAGLADEVEGGTVEKNSWDLSIYSYGSREAAPAPTIPEREAEPPAPATDADVDPFDELIAEYEGASA